MKKISFFSFIFSLIILSACNGNKKENSVEFESYSYEVVAQMSGMEEVDMPGSQYCQITGKGIFPVTIGGVEVPELRDSLMAMAKVIVADNNMVAPIIDEELELTDLSPASTEACSEEIRDLFIRLMSPNIIVWESYNSYYECGAAHGMYGSRFLNYSIVNHQILGLDDIFVTGYKTQLMQLIRQKISEQKVSLLDELDEIPMPSEFEITSEGINFIYPLYAIAPYSEGEIKVELYNYELEDLYKKNVMQDIFAAIEE